MSSVPTADLRPSVALIGFGAFGQLVAKHLAPHCRLQAYDPAVPAEAFDRYLVRCASLREAASCPFVILAVPMSSLTAVVRDIRPHLSPGALIVDVVSVKSNPVAIMRDGLPSNMQILATHPLFGPQSAQDGIRGLKIASPRSGGAAVTGQPRSCGPN